MPEISISPLNTPGDIKVHPTTHHEGPEGE
jgi:hypothetical protein